jgi:hypothetical protein
MTSNSIRPTTRTTTMAMTEARRSASAPVAPLRPGQGRRPRFAAFSNRQSGTIVFGVTVPVYNAASGKRDPDMDHGLALLT